jgi:hypothetical protein
MIFLPEHQSIIFFYPRNAFIFPCPWKAEDHPCKPFFFDKNRASLSKTQRQGFVFPYSNGSSGGKE